MTFMSSSSRFETYCDWLMIMPDIQITFPSIMFQTLETL